MNFGDSLLLDASSPWQRVCVQSRALHVEELSAPLSPSVTNLCDLCRWQYMQVHVPSEATRFLPPGVAGTRRLSARRRRTATASASQVPSGGSGPNVGGRDGGGDCNHRNLASAWVGGETSEVAAALSTSPLLSELFNGKLASTIQMFCRRAVTEASGRRRR